MIELWKPDDRAFPPTYSENLLYNVKIDKFTIAVAEFSFLGVNMAEQIEKTYFFDFEMKNVPFYYFNRLLVPKHHRNKGIGKKLMEIALEEFDNSQLGIYCDLNPYEGPSKMPDLIRFYKLFNFKHLRSKSGIEYQTMIRLPKEKK